jgi:hypothetical protein
MWNALSFRTTTQRSSALRHNTFLIKSSAVAVLFALCTVSAKAEAVEATGRKSNLALNHKSSHLTTAQYLSDSVYHVGVNMYVCVYKAAWATWSSAGCAPIGCWLPTNNIFGADDTVVCCGLAEIDFRACLQQKGIKLINLLLNSIWLILLKAQFAK